MLSAVTWFAVHAFLLVAGAVVVMALREKR